MGEPAKSSNDFCVKHIGRLFQRYDFGIMAKIFFELSNSHYALSELK